MISLINRWFITINYHYQLIIHVCRSIIVLIVIYVLLRIWDLQIEGDQLECLLVPDSSNS